MSTDATSTGAAAAAPTADAGTGLVSTAYADAFVHGPPREGVSRVQTRLHKARILTDELADYFGARRELEITYLKSLQKIAKRSFLSDPSALGPNFAPVYERLVAEIGEVASIHGELERKLEVECEQPMRAASSRGEWARIKEHDDNLSGTLKEIATLESQLAKDQKKVEGASSKKASQAQQKVAETERSLQQTMDLWETEAPFAFEAYQRIDSQRLELMKEVVAKFETAQSDAAQRAMQMTEQSMQVVLSFDAQADMQEYVLKNKTSRRAPGRPSQNRGARNVTPASTNYAAAATIAGAGAAAATGTAAGLGRSNSIGSGRAQAAASPQRNGLSEFGRPVPASSASIHSVERPGGQSQDQGTASKILGGSTLKSALTRFGRGKSNRNVNNEGPQSYGSLADGPSGMPPPSNATSKRGGRDDSDRRSLDSRSDAGASAAVSGSLMAPMAPTSRIPTSSLSTPPPTTTTSASNAPQVDAEGFSIPPQDRDRKPWELGNVGVPSPSLMDDEANDTFGDSAAAPKMTGMSISSKPIAEDSASDQAALERMRSTLLTARAPAANPQRRNTTRRDRRDVRNTTYNPLAVDESSRPVSTFGLPLAASSPIQQPVSPVFTGIPGTGPGRSQSIVSSGSASNLGNTTLESVSSVAPIASGLNAQIVERVNVVLSGREVSKIMVVGEISVSVRDLPAQAPVHLRVDAFEELEKAAPNPQFLTEIGGKPGEYSLDVGGVAKSGGSAFSGAGRATILKYQLHVPANKARQYVPLDVNPQWRTEDNQTSILINFSASPDSRIASAVAAGLAQGASANANAAIQDVTLSVEITSPGVSNVMSKPNAVYLAEQKKLFWRLSEGVPAATAGVSPVASKALARFKVDSKTEVRPIEVRWKLPGLILSSLGLSLVNSDGIAFGSVARQTVSGKYIASP